MNLLCFRFNGRDCTSMLWFTLTDVITCVFSRRCSTVSWTLWRTFLTSSSSTCSSCSSSLSSPCSSLRGSSSTAPTSPRVWRKTAGTVLYIQTWCFTFANTRFYTDIIYVFFDPLPPASCLSGVSFWTSTVMVWKLSPECGRSTSFTTITFSGPSWRSSPCLRERAGHCK